MVFLHGVAAWSSGRWLVTRARTARRRATHRHGVPVLDVRRPEERAEGHPPCAQLVPLPPLEPQLSRVRTPWRFARRPVVRGTRAA